MKIKFYLTLSGRSPIKEFLNGQSQKIKSEFLDAVSLLASGQVLTMPLSRNLANIYKGLHELRFKDNTGQTRFFYYIKKGDAIYMLHALRKKTQVLPKKEINLILKRVKEV